MQDRRPGDSLAKELQELKKGSMVNLYLRGGHVVGISLERVSRVEGLIYGGTWPHTHSDRPLYFRISQLVGFEAKKEDDK